MGTPSVPAPVAPAAVPPPPTAVDPAVLAARQNEQDAAAMAQGRGSTILGNPQGDLSPDTSQKKTLLGGVS